MVTDIHVNLAYITRDLGVNVDFLKWPKLARQDQRIRDRPVLCQYDRGRPHNGLLNLICPRFVAQHREQGSSATGEDKPRDHNICIFTFHFSPAGNVPAQPVCKPYRSDYQQAHRSTCSSQCCTMAVTRTRTQVPRLPDPSIRSGGDFGLNTATLEPFGSVTKFRR